MIMSLILHELIHFFVALAIAGFIYLKWRNWKLVVWVFAVGIFLDIDHLIDCYLTNGDFNVFENSYFATSQKAYVLLHSWELLIPWWIWIIYSKKYSLGWTISLAFVGHLLIDQFSYSSQPLTYFLTYRILHGFDLSELFIK